MHISVLTPDREIFQGNIVSVKVPGTLGQFQVLRNHAPIVSSLESGVIEIVTAEGEHRFYDKDTGKVEIASDKGKKVSYKITNGFIEVLNNEVSLLVTGIA